MAQPPPRLHSRLIRLSWPAVLQSLGGGVVGLVDTLVLGGISPADQGAVGFAAFVFWFLEILPVAFFTAMQLRIAQSEEYSTNDIRDLTFRGAVFGGALGLLVAALIHFAGDLALEVLNVDRELAPLCQKYLEVRSLGLPLVFAGFSFAAAHRGRGYFRVILVAGVIMALANCLLDFALVYGLGPMSPWPATEGVAVASLVTQVAGALAMLATFVVFFKTEPGAPKRRIQLPWSMGLSMALQAALENITWLGWGAMIAVIGAVTAAAHAVAINLLILAFAIGYGIRSAAVTVVGELTAKPRAAELRQVARQSALIGMLGQTAVASLLWMLRGVVAPAFTNSPDVAKLVDELLLIGVVFMFFDGAYLVLVGVLRGLSDVRWPAVAFVVVGIFGFAPLAWWLCVGLRWGAPGAWYAAISFEIVIALTLWLRVGNRITALTAANTASDVPDGTVEPE